MRPHAAEERLALYAAGDLDAPETASIREHLETCADCRKAAAELERICALLGSDSEEPEPESLAEVRSRVRSRIAPRKPQVWRWAAAAAAAAAICAVWFVEYQPEPPLPAMPQIAVIPPAPAPEHFVGQTLSLRGAPSPARGQLQSRSPAARGSRAATGTERRVETSLDAARTSACATNICKEQESPGIKSVALISQTKGPPLIKIMTTDPHVLILLASDERTNTQ